MRNEREHIKNVGWRTVRDIQLVKIDKKTDIFEGYYFRHSQGIEEGYQKVQVRCVIDRYCDDSWKVVDDQK